MLAAKSQNRETNVANKADSEICFAKDAVSSPTQNAPKLLAKRNNAENPNPIPNATP